MTTVNVICLLLLLSALIAATGFVGTYASFAPWRSNEVGRSMMLLAMSVIMLIVSGILLNVLGPDYRFRDVVRMSTYVVLNVALWRQLLVLLKVLNGKLTTPPKATAPEPEAEIIMLPTPRGSEEAEDKQSVI